RPRRSSPGSCSRARDTSRRHAVRHACRDATTHGEATSCGCAGLSRNSNLGALRQKRVNLAGQSRDLLGELLVLPGQIRVRLEQRLELVRFRLPASNASFGVLLFVLAVQLELVTERLVA